LNNLAILSMENDVAHSLNYADVIYSLFGRIMEILHGAKTVFTCSATTPPKVNQFDDLLAIKGHRPLTYHIIVHIAIGKKETMTMQSCKLHKQISDQYLVNRLTSTLLIVFLNNNKLLKLTMGGGKLFRQHVQ